MDTFETIVKRVSVRKYADTAELPKEDLSKIVFAGSRAASANNIQPFEFIVVTDSTKRKELASIAPNNGPYMAFSPAVIVVISKPEKYYLEDGSAATQNILLMSRDMGYGSVWIAGDKKEYSDDILRTLGAPKDYKLVSMVCIGKPQGEFPETPKKDIEDILHWEIY